ncbi:MAG: beta-N-acetylhexosaminidase [Gemmatimonadaceae bacterium]
MNRPFALAVACAAVLGCRSANPTPPTSRPTLDPAASAPRIVPAPASLTRSSDRPFIIDSLTSIVVDPGNAELLRIAALFAAVVRPATGFEIPIGGSSSASTGSRIALRLGGDAQRLGGEGYDLVVTADSVRLVAAAPAGVFWGVQTLRQLLPAMVESHMALASVPWAIPAVRIVDQPRFAWRGAMLDVARHFFTVDEVKQFVDLLAMYKLNVLHLHLSDDQGWRIEIKSRPALTAQGGATEVGGGPGGFYTQGEYADIVRYAGERYITIVPEIDMPGHTNAALVSNPDLSCSNRPSALYSKTDVGWSTFCVEKEGTYALIDDIVREIAAITPGAYFHIGGDEVHVLKPPQYALFVERVQGIVEKYGKRTIGWEEIAKARLRPATLVQNWRTDSAGPATAQGAKLVLSPAPRTYIDMKYDASTELGLRWAGLLEVRTVYDWDPATHMKGASAGDIAGIETTLWSETIRNITAAQYLAVPRLPALAEVGWTPQSGRDWESFRLRLAAQAPRWNLLGINYYRSPQIPW